jgi:polyhydroxyalkanoate synthesis repressor PhaR
MPPIGTKGQEAKMTAQASQPIVIKKYANRRLYHTGTSAYVTLEDLAHMVKRNEEFLVQDAKTGEDLTRSVLTQIIFELENKEGQQTLLPVAFLRQLIGYYGDQMQGLVPSYLSYSMENFQKEQQKFRDQMTRAMKGDVLGAMQDQAQTNMKLFQDALRMFSPFAGQAGAAASQEPQAEAPKTDDVQALRRELDAMRDKIDKLSK